MSDHRLIQRWFAVCQVWSHRRFVHVWGFVELNLTKRIESHILCWVLYLTISPVCLQEDYTRLVTCYFPGPELWWQDHDCVIHGCQEKHCLDWSPYHYKACLNPFVYCRDVLGVMFTGVIILIICQLLPVYNYLPHTILISSHSHPRLDLWCVFNILLREGGRNGTLLIKEWN